ncbi:MAG: single-stranded-DNA-specific exonuclease RecJ, partial [Dehalococcoidia bacterium]|nr:single-stranded-DNA-specific exonuclease RecJ [Dehalococcoidia bacterium]
SRQGLRKRWDIMPAAPFQQLQSLPHLSPLMAQVLYNRGLRESGDVDAFLYAVDEADPFLLADMDRAVARLQRALERDESIAVFGDFDADGVSGTAILVQCFARYGNQVVPYIPHRVREGYGLNKPALDHLRSEGVSLVVTVDCGISSVEEVRHAASLGMDVIITDHHAVPEALPPAVAVVNPLRRDSAYPFRDLCGAGVAYKVAEAVTLSMDSGDFNVEDYLDLAALGTIADMVPLTGENRLLARRGLDKLNTSPGLGLREMIRTARLTPGTLDADSVSFSIAPRLNSAGRLGDAKVAYRLLTTDSLIEAQEIARFLEEQNADRQRLTQMGVDEAREKAEGQVGRDRLIMVGSPGFQSGVIGLVASRLADEFYRPSVIVGMGESESRGSARSIPEFDMHHALAQCADLLTRFGGHPMAAGFTVPNHNLTALHERLAGLARDALDGAVLEPFITVDAQVKLSELNWSVMESFQGLAPFGKGNPQPTFLSEGIRVLECRKVGNSHLRLRLHDGKLTWPAVAFGLGCFDMPATGSRLDIVFRLTVDTWNGEKKLQLEIEDMRPEPLRT